MGSQRIIVFMIFACWEGYVAAQGRVEYLTSPPVGTVTATPMVQPYGQFVIPAVIKPLLAPEPELPRPPAVPDFNEYPFYPPMPMPPIIFQDDDDNDWHHLLYFLIFALKNRRFGYDGGYNGYGYSQPPIPYAFYPVPAGSGFDRCGCEDSCGGNNVNYIPYPVPVPMAGPGVMADPNIYTAPGDDLTITTGQPLNGRDNDVTLLIRTEK